MNPTENNLKFKPAAPMSETPQGESGGTAAAPAAVAPEPVPDYPLDQLIGDLIEDRRFQFRPDALRTRSYLAAQTLIKTLIPISEGEAKGATQSFNINGFGFSIRKGVFQSVPEDVAQMISDTYGQDVRIANEHPLNLANNTAAAHEFAR